MSPLAPQFSEPSKYAYHYTNMATARDHIIPRRRIRLSRYTATNDPKERKEWTFTLWTRNLQRGLVNYELQKLSLELSQALKERTRLLCCSTDAPSLSGNHLDDIHKRGFTKPRMWAQYAGDHSGVCLVFDRQRLGEEIACQCGAATLAAANVKYLDRHLVADLAAYTIDADVLERIGFEDYVRWHLRHHVDVLFFEKMTDWQQEAEFRWVLFSKDTGDIFVDFKDSLVGMIFGDTACADDIANIIQATEDLGILSMGLKWRNCAPWLDYGNFLYDPVFRRIQREKTAKPPAEITDP